MSLSEQLYSLLGVTQADELQLEASKYSGYLRSRTWWKPGLDWVSNEGGMTAVKVNLCLSALAFNPKWHDGFRDYAKELVSLYGNTAFKDHGINEVSWDAYDSKGEAFGFPILLPLSGDDLLDNSEKPLFVELTNGFTPAEVDCLTLWAKTKSPTEVAQVLDWPLFAVRSVIKRAYAKGKRIEHKGVAFRSIG